MKIGFIGLGIIGVAWLSSSSKVFMKWWFSTVARKTEPLKEAGAQTAAAPAEVAKNTDILITMLANPKAVEVPEFGEKWVSLRP